MKLLEVEHSEVSSVRSLVVSEDLFLVVHSVDLMSQRPNSTSNQATTPLATTRKPPRSTATVATNTPKPSTRKLNDTMVAVKPNINATSKTSRVEVASSNAERSVLTVEATSTPNVKSMVEEEADTKNRLDNNTASQPVKSMAVTKSPLDRNMASLVDSQAVAMKNLHASNTVSLNVRSTAVLEVMADNHSMALVTKQAGVNLNVAIPAAAATAARSASEVVAVTRAQTAMTRRSSVDATSLRIAMMSVSSMGVVSIDATRVLIVMRKRSSADVISREIGVVAGSAMNMAGDEGEAMSMRDVGRGLNEVMR